METFVGGVLLLILSGGAWLAYNEPEVVVRLVPWLCGAVIVIFFGTLIWNASNTVVTTGVVLALPPGETPLIYRTADAKRIPDLASLVVMLATFAYLTVMGLLAGYRKSKTAA